MKVPFLSFPLLTGLFLITLSSLHATIVVDWGGNYVSSSQPFGNPGGVNPGDPTQYSQFGGFDGNGNPLLLNPTSGYSGTSATFYGEIVRTAGTGYFPTTGLTTNTSGLINVTSLDRISLKLDDNAFSALILWKQADFLAGNTGTLNLGSGSTISLNLNTYTRANGGRAVVRSGASYYISDIIFTASGSSSFDLTTLTWYNYNPSSAIDTIGTQTSLVSGGAIANVKELGFYFSVGSVGSGGNAVRIDSVEFNAVSVPEPRAFALLLGSSLTLALLRRRKV